MEKDRTKMHDLVEQLPDKADEMIALFDDWASKSNVLARKEVNRIGENLKADTRGK